MQLKAFADQLTTVGLNEKEARVYVAALFLGPAAVQRIAEQAGVNRATTYVVLDKLAKMGLVSQAGKRTKAKFAAEDPEALERWLASQEAHLRGQREAAHKALPALKAARRAQDHAAPIVRFYKGLEGIRTIYAENIRKAKPKTTIYAIMNADEADKAYPESAVTLPKGRVKKHIASKLFYWSTQYDIPSQPQSLRETKRLKKSPHADISIYEDRAALLTYKGEDSIGVVIESREIVAALR